MRKKLEWRITYHILFSMANQERKEKSKYDQESGLPLKLLIEVTSESVRRPAVNRRPCRLPRICSDPTRNSRHPVWGLNRVPVCQLAFLSLYAVEWNIAGIVGAIVANFSFNISGISRMSSPWSPWASRLINFGSPRSLWTTAMVSGIPGILCSCALLALPFLDSDTKYTPVRVSSVRLSPVCLTIIWILLGVLWFSSQGY